jgi:hypothetical protein
MEIRKQIKSRKWQYFRLMSVGAAASLFSINHNAYAAGGTAVDCTIKFVGDPKPTPCTGGSMEKHFVNSHTGNEQIGAATCGYYYGAQTIPCGTGVAPGGE